MPQSRKKKAARPKQTAKAEAAKQLPLGMPAKESVVKTFHFTSPEGKDIEVERTDETDAYDPPLKPELEPKKESS